MVRRLDLYLFRQCLTPIVFSVVVVTLIVWMTQSMQRVDILVEHGSTFAVFAWISILIVPSLLAVIIPFALFGAALYSLQRLHADSEIAVMFAAGVSRWRIAAPFLSMAAIAVAATYWVNLDLMPRSYRLLKQEVAQVRADFAAAILRSGEFTTVIDGFTIYVEDIRSGGQLVGLLINDFRDSDAKETYMAQRGLLRETEAGPVLYLANGNIQTVSDDGAVEILQFEETAVNISDYDRARDELQLELTERYLSELFNPDFENPWDRNNAGKLYAEGHNRLASPLYAVAYALLAIYALIGGAYQRRGYGVRIALACAIAGGLRVAGFVLQGVAAENGANWLQYAIPLTAWLVFAALISGVVRLRPPEFRAPNWPRMSAA